VAVLPPPDAATRLIAVGLIPERSGPKREVCDGAQPAVVPSGNNTGSAGIILVVCWWPAHKFKGRT
jgi:hypothetical protein